jgi:hypothetical protein
MNEPFELLDTKREQNGMLRLRYGSRRDDPMLILTLTPSYVAHASGKTPPITLQNIQESYKEMPSI